MKTKTAIALAALLCGLLMVGGGVWAMSSGSYAINWDVIGGGGEPASSADYAVGGTIGQPAAESSFSTDYGLWSGYWYPAVSGINNLEGQVYLQGRPAPPHASWITELTVTFFQSFAVVRTENVTTDSVGNFTVPDVAAGTYDVCVKSPRALSELETGVVVVSGTPTSVDFGTLREGDASNDDAISLADYALLYAAYGSEPGDGNWNDNCDFNRNGAVDLGDYALLYSNYGQVGHCYAF